MVNGNSHSAIDNLINMNDLKQWWDSVKGKNIFGQEVTPLTEEGMMDIAMSVSPAMGSIRGGKVVKNTLDSMLKKYFGGVKGKESGVTLDDFASQIKFKNKINAARIKNQQVLDKYKIADPDKQGMVDPVSALLNYFSKN